MAVALKGRSVLARAVVWSGLQVVFLLWVHPVWRWARSDRRVYFCFAALALCSLSLVAILPILSQVSPRVRVLFFGMFAVTVWQLTTASLALWYIVAR